MEHNLFNMQEEPLQLTKKEQVMQVLEHHCIGYKDRKTATELLTHLPNIKDDFELRLIIKDIKNSEDYLRIIGSNSSGVWLALQDDEVNANQYMVSRTKSSLETCLKNGVDINIFYAELNELKSKYYPQHNQESIEHPTTIKRFSNDLLDNEW